jgi:hypothetical protein
VRTCSESATSWANGRTSGLRFAFLAPMGLGPAHMIQAPYSEALYADDHKPEPQACGCCSNQSFRCAIVQACHTNSGIMQVAHTAHAQVVEEAVTEGAVCVELSLEALHVDQEVDDVAVREAVAERLGGCGRHKVRVS